MTTRISVALKGDAQVGTCDGEYSPEYYNERYVEAVTEGQSTLTFVDIDGDYFTFLTTEIKAISFVVL
jgi:hypothetical protein